MTFPRYDFSIKPCKSRPKKLRHEVIIVTSKLTLWRKSHLFSMKNFLLSLKLPFFHSSRSHSQNTVDRFWFNPTAWHRDVMTSRHDITKLILPISARRCARKMIRFCFYDTLGCWIKNWCQFCICMMTSRHDVMPWRQRHAVLISACRIDRKVIILLFL